MCCFALLQYASEEKDGVKYMRSGDFIQRFLGFIPEREFNEESVKLLAGIVDTSKDG